MIRPRLYLSFESLRAGNGGIGRVARLIARVVGERAAAGELTADGIVLNDPEPPADTGARFVAAAGSRARFVAAVIAAAFSHTHFAYDCAGMARAHGWLPRPRRPFLSWIHGVESWAGFAQPRQVAASRRADVLVVNTAYTRGRAAELDPTMARAAVCWLATETDDPPARPRDTTGPPRVTILGRVDENGYKGHAELIRCWPAVRAAVPDAVLTIAGSGPGLEQYQRGAAGLPAAAVEFPGFVPEAEVDDLWARTTVFAMPSRGEGFGLVYIEAMRWSIPVIASVHDGGQEINVDNVT